MAIRIDAADTLSSCWQEQAAELLVEGFRHSPSAWDDLESARNEVATFVEPERIAFVATEDETVVGWIGAIKHSAQMWELHPLAVRPGYQGKGIGRKLVEVLEAEARRDGVCTIYLGADDDFGGTDLFGKNLYPNVLERLQRLGMVSQHPFVFYEKLGYIVVGVIPDAGGIGKHDIMMAKKVPPPVKNASHGRNS